MRKRLTNVNVTKPKPTNSSPILMIGYELKTQDEDRVFYIFKQENMYAQNSMMLLVKNYDNSN